MVITLQFIKLKSNIWLLMDMEIMFLTKNIVKVNLMVNSINNVQI